MVVVRIGTTSDVTFKRTLFIYLCSSFCTAERSHDHRKRDENKEEESKLLEVSQRTFRSLNMDG